jgi:protein involved in polysaccharide export with SLBB domain
MPSTATPAFYSIAKPGELTMQVNVWGMVNHPGRYEISITTDLLQLISLAGGPTPDADVNAVKVTRYLKTETGITRGEYIVDLSDLYRVSESSLVLQPGDTITMDRSSWVSIRDIIGIVTSVAVITVSVTTVVNSRRN